MGNYFIIRFLPQENHQVKAQEIMTSKAEGNHSRKRWHSGSSFSAQEIRDGSTGVGQGGVVIVQRTLVV